MCLFGRVSGGGTWSPSRGRTWRGQPSVGWGVPSTKRDARATSLRRSRPKGFAPLPRRSGHTSKGGKGKATAARTTSCFGFGRLTQASHSQHPLFLPARLNPPHKPDGSRGASPPPPKQARRANRANRANWAKEKTRAGQTHLAGELSQHEDVSASKNRRSSRKARISITCGKLARDNERQQNQG